MNKQFHCECCGKHKNINQLGSTRNTKGYGMTRCKQCVGSTMLGRTRLAKEVKEEQDEIRIWMLGACETKGCDFIGPIVLQGDKYRCHEHDEELTRMKDKAIVPEFVRPQFTTKKERKEYIKSFCESSEKNLNLILYDLI